MQQANGRSRVTFESQPERTSERGAESRPFSCPAGYPPYKVALWRRFLPRPEDTLLIIALASGVYALWATFGALVRLAEINQRLIDSIQFLVK